MGIAYAVAALPCGVRTRGFPGGSEEIAEPQTAPGASTGGGAAAGDATEGGDGVDADGDGEALGTEQPSTCWIVCLAAAAAARTS